MSRWLERLEDGTYKTEIESMEICKYKVNEVCCNGDCKEYVADYPYPRCKCESKEDCRYFKKEDGKIKDGKIVRRNSL